MSSNKLTRKKAFTMVELAVAMAVTVVFLALATALLANVLDEKEDTNKDALIAYEMLLVESRVESFYFSFSKIDPEQTEWTFEKGSDNELFAKRTVEGVEETHHISFDTENQTLQSTDRDRITEFKQVVNVVFEVLSDNSVKITVTFESLKTPIVRLFTLKGVEYE